MVKDEYVFVLCDKCDGEGKEHFTNNQGTERERDCRSCLGYGGWWEDQDVSRKQRRDEFNLRWAQGSDV